MINWLPAGANVEEAVGAHSDRDFAAKLTIACKEARETRYRIRLPRDSDYLSPNLADSLLADADELLRLLGSIQRTMKSKLRNS